MKSSVLGIAHNDLDRNEIRGNEESFGKHVYHGAGRIDCCGAPLSPGTLPLLQVIEHLDAYRKRALFLDNPRVQAREREIGSAAEDTHWPTSENPSERSLMGSIGHKHGKVDLQA